MENKFLLKRLLQMYSVRVFFVACNYNTTDSYLHNRMLESENFIHCFEKAKDLRLSRAI